MHGLIRFSLRQVVLYNLIFVVLIVAGAFALLEIPVERYPNVRFGEVNISTVYPGASPQDVETLVTRKLEDALDQVENIEFIESTSYRERSLIHLKFIDDSDYAALYDEVRFKVLEIMRELPTAVEPPQVEEVNINNYVPVLVLNLAGERGNRALTLMAEQLKLRLEKLSGVKEVRLSGEYVREFHVYLDPAKMRALGVSFEHVAQALQRANLSVAAGKFSDASGEFTVRVDEKFRSREDIAACVVRLDGDAGLVRVGDVLSRAEPAYREPPVMSSVNGKDAVALQLIKDESGNALRIVEQVRLIMEEFRPTLADQGVELIVTQDSSIRVRNDLTTLGSNMLLGIVLVSAIIWYFMGFRNAGLTTVGIPFAFMVTLVIMYLSGNSLNQITLFAFVLVTGIVVDDAIVVVENIYRHVEEGKPLLEAIVNGTVEVLLPVVAATSTTLAAFLPMLIMSGSTGEFFAQVPITISFALAASLLECLFILPIHYLDYGPRLGKQTPRHSVEQEDNLLLRLLRRWVNAGVRAALRLRYTSLTLVAALFLTSVAIFWVSLEGSLPLIKIKFFPDDYSVYYVDIEAPGSTPLSEVFAKAKQVAAFVTADGPGMAESAAAYGGFQIGEDYQQVFGNHLATVIVTLPPPPLQRFSDYPVNEPLVHLDFMRQRLQQAFPDPSYRLRVKPQKDGPPSGKDISVRLLGADFADLRRLAREMSEFMREDPQIGPYLADFGDDQGQSRRVLQLQVQAERAHQHGLDTAQVALLAGSVLDGRYLGKFRAQDEEIDLKLKLDPQFLHQAEDALRLPLLEHPSGPLYLGDVVKLHAYTEGGTLKRYQNQRAISLQANLSAAAPTSTPAVVKRIEQHYQSIRQNYPGTTLLFGGAHENTQRSYTSLGYAFGIALLVMYMILATQFQSYLQPFIILSSVVFALIGVILGSFLTQTLFTVNSFVAVVGLTGVVVNNSLVLIDFINARYRDGLDRHAAIFEGIRIRLRPILLTTLTTTLGLLPMALGIPHYSLVWGTMASTFVTGLATSAVLTLLVVPVLWDLLAQAKTRHPSRRDGGGADSAKS